MYGSVSTNQKYKISRQLLHAHQIRFTHPITHAPMNIIAPLPEDFQKTINKFF